jgi:hypothetical protein
VIACITGATSHDLRTNGESVLRFRFLEVAARALGRVWEYARWRSIPERTGPVYAGFRVDRAREVCRRAIARGDPTLAAAEVEQLLTSAGVSASELRGADGTGLEGRLRIWVDSLFGPVLELERGVPTEPPGCRFGPPNNATDVRRCR